MTAPITKTPKIVAYLRESTDKQGKSQLGFGAQDHTIEEHRARIGGRIVARFTETESGKRSDRPELAKAIAHAKKVGAILMVAKLDRLSRNTVHFLRMIEESGVRFYFCDFPTIPDGPMGRLFLTLMIAFAEFEREIIGDRTSAGLQQLKRNGLWSNKQNRIISLGGVRPGQHLPSDEAAARGRAAGAQASREAAAAAYADVEPVILEARDAGDSLRTVAAALNEAGHRTRGGSDWTAAAVLKVERRARACVV